MISPDHVRTMARYNRWQNRSLYGAADSLPDEARREDRGAFFGSIFGTLNHLLWADQMWMRRFAETPAPAVRTISESPELHADWM
ncbi:MAG: DinB family protein, partial [Pseudomonadota bacterium]